MSVVLQMPTDLRPTSKPAHTLEFDSRQPRGITRLTVDIPSSRVEQPRNVQPPPPARWRTPEFLFYAVMFVLVVPMMIWVPVRLSSSEHPNYKVYQYKLSPGWIFGRPVDNSDAQYRSFRSNVPILAALVAVFLGAKALYAQWKGRVLRSDNTHSDRVPFLLTFSAILLLALHGTSVLKMAVIFTVNYWIAKFWKGSKLTPIITWMFNGAVLFANETFSGYHFAALHPALLSLDELSGIYPRWHVIFNITMLRLVSFNMDYYWACSAARVVDTREPIAHKERTQTAHPLDFYSFPNYIAYVVYPPLYIGGPIITYNDFLWQLRRPIPLAARDVFSYALRFLTCLLTMEFILHFMYMVAIKDTSAWYGDSVAELSLIGFWNLIIVWLKLLIPWRFFRLWALLDGVDPPENMVRCMANNYSALGFWRSWHRSYNLWIVRYIYIPLGGTKNSLFTTVLVFSFVALWHDLSFRLLAWGWLVSLFILPEILARYLLPATKFGDKPWYRHICAIGAVFNILMMMAANLVGFVIGTDGVAYLARQLFSGWDGIQFLLFASACLFVAAQVMFEYREEEMRRGIYRRC